MDTTAQQMVISIKLQIASLTGEIAAMEQARDQLERESQDLNQEIAGRQQLLDGEGNASFPPDANSRMVSAQIAELKSRYQQKRIEIRQIDEDILRLEDQRHDLQNILALHIKETTTPKDCDVDEYGICKPSRSWKQAANEEIVSFDRGDSEAEKLGKAVAAIPVMLGANILDSLPGINGSWPIISDIKEVADQQEYYRKRRQRQRMLSEAAGIKLP